MKSSISRFDSGLLMNSCATGLVAVDGVAQRALDLGVEDHAAGVVRMTSSFQPVLDRVLNRDLLGLDRELDLLLGAEPLQPLPAQLLREVLRRRRREIVRAVREEVRAEHHVLRRRRERAPVCRREDVVRRQHQDPRLACASALSGRWTAIWSPSKSR
jgi:hypothetical protein